MITEASIRQAAQRQPKRYILEEDTEGKLVRFQDADTGYLWFLLPDGVDGIWAWIA